MRRRGLAARCYTFSAQHAVQPNCIAAAAVHRNNTDGALARPQTAQRF